MRKKSNLYGVAINDADYAVTKNKTVNGKQVRIWRCPYYSRWSDMVRRCYSENKTCRTKKYQECSVCDEWLIFSNFRKWMISQDWQGNELDKDLVKLGNKVYCPEYCVFIDSMTNTFTEDCGASRGEHPIGSSFNKALGKFESYCRNPFTKKMERFGLHNTAQSAHMAWKKRKHELACQVALLQSDKRVSKTLMEMYQ